jgi:hypothetical protein
MYSLEYWAGPVIVLVNLLVEEVESKKSPWRFVD